MSDAVGRISFANTPGTPELTCRELLDAAIEQAGRRTRVFAGSMFGKQPFPWTPAPVRRGGKRWRLRIVVPLEQRLPDEPIDLGEAYAMCRNAHDLRDLGRLTRHSRLAELLDYLADRVQAAAGQGAS